MLCTTLKRQNMMQWKIMTLSQMYLTNSLMGLLLMSSEQYRAPEVLFNPSIIGKEDIGIHQVLVNALLKSDRELRRKLSPNIRLVGGSTMFNGLGDRLVSEVRKLLLSDTKIKITALRRSRTIAAWIGGSILASLSIFKKMWITAQEWNEHGNQVIFKKTY